MSTSKDPVVSKSQLRVATTMFFIGATLTVTYNIYQFIHVWNNGAEGFSLVMALCVGLFSIYNMSLALTARRLHLQEVGAGVVEPSWLPTQAVILYLLWVVCSGAVLILVVLTELGETVFWDWSETVAAVSVSTGLAAVWWYRKRNNLPTTDPMVKGYKALAFKAIAHVFQAGKILLYGGSGWSPVSIAIGNITIWLRMIVLWVYREEKLDDRNRLGSWVSEIGNGATWLLVTIVYFVVWRGYGWRIFE